MAAQEAGLPLSPAAYAEALDRKRQSLDREISEFTKRKEEEFNAYERRLSVSGNLEQAQLNEDGRPPGASLAKSATSTAPRRAPNDKGHGDPGQPSPLSPQHDKERELHGLFLPHFIPLLDEPPAKRRSFPSPSLSYTEIPVQSAGVNSQDPSTFSPRTSPSPTLIASHPPPGFPPTTISSLLSPARALPSSTLAPRSPTGAVPSSSAIPRHVRVSSWSSTFSQHSDPGFASNISPRSERPELGTRSSSSQSEASTTSLRSSLRKSSSATRALTKKHVRLSIGNAIIAPSESPVQTKTAFSPPSYTSTSYPPSSTLVSDEIGDRGRIEQRDKRAGKARIDDEGGARRRRKKRTPSAKPLKTETRREEEPLDYFPPQPLRSPGLPKSVVMSGGNVVPRYNGTELIEPTTPTTPLALLGGGRDDFDIDDPLFGGGIGAQDYQQERPERSEDEEDMDVVNGHDLVEDKDGDEFDVALPSPSPHASSMPIGIKFTGWKIGR